MKVLFLGYAISMKEASKLYGASIAGNKMQINVLKQLSRYGDLALRCITIYPTAAYPKGRLFIRRKRIRLFRGFYSIRVGFLNLPVIKQFLETIVTYLEARKIVKDEGIKTIFTFNLFPQVGLPAKWLKRRYGCELICLLADLPIDDAVGRKGISYILRKSFDHLTLKLFASYDKFITLNKHAISRYAPGKNYIVVEGGIDPKEATTENAINHYADIINKRDYHKASDISSSQPTDESCNHKMKRIVYSGALTQYSGIIELIEAMKYIKEKEVFLDIYGDGPLAKDVREYTGINKNIRYHGSIHYSLMRQIQREAYLLVNPRPVDHPIARVTFPSKLFEYMLSGVPVLTTRLNGLTEEYLDKLFVVQTDDAISLGMKINQILMLPEEMLREKAEEARKFILEHKTWEKQCERIYQFIMAGEYNS
ncbi:glycosyltransferase [Mobilitalea sibirica]|uniref:Glycosyltransferase n=1 Tax=Mobilitalea sibirica TaxID=1462919 RepID=A0A8J7H096_9FIRM|nr:glycosyltransferase [Mobilitalea sibirica]MBH1939418.1 glycosyltransferase [Mobilitalea sibirica]